jgi:general secretion pathway protein K
MKSFHPIHAARPLALNGRGRARTCGPNGATSGVALVIVMISIFVLTMLAGGFALSMKVETRLARNANSETELEWLGRSAVECARWELAQQLMISREPYDGLDQVWAGGQGGIGTSNSPLADFKHELNTPNGGIATWTIVDLERKMNINVANEPLLQQGLTVAGVNAGDFTPIVNSILDWIDLDDNSRNQGAESEYYQSMDPPYFAKNGPIDDLSELLLIIGITPEIYLGIVSTNYQPGYFNPQNRFGPQGGAPVPTVGLSNLFTPLSVGKININTASADVLQLVPGVPREAAEGIVGARSGEDDGSGLLGPYKNIGQIQRVPEVTPIISRQIQQFCDVRSCTFEVQVDAHMSGYHRHFVGIIGRPPGNPRGIVVLNFYWTD